MPKPTQPNRLLPGQAHRLDDPADRVGIEPCIDPSARVGQEQDKAVSKIVSKATEVTIRTANTVAKT
ncbi:unannotated protein [freshwater metagenome]|uniref:Unannotated protein n=1 Tax=freshwater metagenome TaxID=449393 RepID=A0A6J7LVR4_9ZZZZ